MHLKNYLGGKTQPAHSNNVHTLFFTLKTHTSLKMFKGSPRPPITNKRSPTKEDVWPKRGDGDPSAWITFNVLCNGSSSKESFLRPCLPIPPKPPNTRIVSLQLVSPNVQAEWPQRYKFSVGSPVIIIWVAVRLQLESPAGPANDSKTQIWCHIK